MQKVCNICGFTTDNGRVFSNHIRWKHKMPIDSAGYVQYKTRMRTVYTAHTKPRVVKTFVCPVCGKLFELCNTEAYFNRKAFLSHRHCCSSKCAHTRSLTEEVRGKISQTLKARTKEGLTGFAAPNYLQRDDVRRNHSKRELEIVEYFKKNFPEDEWKQGFIRGSQRYHDAYINPDLHSDKLKVVIEYDGIWHFKDIKGQLAQKQHTDRAVLAWCIEHNYRLIRIDEDLKLSNEQIADAVYGDDTPIQLFNSQRYGYLYM